MISRSVYREDHEMFRASVRRFLERECLPRQAEWDKAGQVDRETWLKAGKEGLLCLSLPDQYGGAGGDFGHCAVLIEELAYANVSGLGFPLHSDIIAPYIYRLGSEEQKSHWLPKAAKGEVILAIAMSEPGAGSDLKAVRTTARRDGGEYVITAARPLSRTGSPATWWWWSRKPIRLRVPRA